MSDIAIKVESLSKQYKIGAQQINGAYTYKSLREELMKVVRAPFRRAAGLLRGESYSAADLGETIWALEDVSFEVERGEVVGIIGRNGAGKTTLLKLLSRITEPTNGRAVLHGRVGSLLEVGTGFHPELTGRENIYLNGSILGMHRNEIEKKFDEIVEFSGVRKFIDTPVKHYSSGMYVRLAFSVAAHLEPEILMVDEVLSVGDVSFQKKCLGKMGDVAASGRTILLVSHNMGAINQMCHRAIWIDEGHLRMDNKAEKVVSSYLMSGSGEADGQTIWSDGIANGGVDEFKIIGVRIINERGKITSKLDSLQPFWVEILYRIEEQLPITQVGLRIHSNQGGMVFDAYDIDDQRYIGPRSPGNYISRCRIPGGLLNAGRYVISLYASMTKIKILAYIQDALLFDIEHSSDSGSHSYSGRKAHGVIHPKQLQWEQEKIFENDMF